MDPGEVAAPSCPSRAARSCDSRSARHSRWRPNGSSRRVFPLTPPSPCPGRPLPGVLSTRTSSTSLPPPGCTRRRSMEASKARSTSWSRRAAAVRSSTTTTTAGWISSCSRAPASKALRRAQPTACTRTIVTGRSRMSRKRPAWAPRVGLPESASGTTTTTASTTSSAPPSARTPSTGTTATEPSRT